MDTTPTQPQQPVPQENPAASVLNTPPVAEAPVAPSSPSVPVQEAAATMTAPMKKSNTTLWIALLILVVVITAGLIYVVYSMNATSSPQTNSAPQPTTAEQLNQPTVTTAPQTESEEVDQIDTSYPTSDVTSIENDVKSL